MKRAVFRVVFWVLWPLIWVYAPLRARARVLVVCGDEFLVVKPYFGSGDWQLPGGGIKFGERANTAAMRELREEVSIIVNQVHALLPAHTYTEKGLLLRYVLFYKKVTVKPITLKNSEIAAIAWLPLNSLGGCASHVKHAVNTFDKVHLLK